MIIKTSFTYKPKRKRKTPKKNVARRPTQEQLRLREEAKLVPPPKYKMQDRSIPSLKTHLHNTSAQYKLKYTGSTLLGIGLLHKSTYTTITSQEASIEVTQMRRS